MFTFKLNLNLACLIAVASTMSALPSNLNAQHHTSPYLETSCNDCQTGECGHRQTRRHQHPKFLGHGRHHTKLHGRFRSCPDCACEYCELKIEDSKEKKTCFKVEQKSICVPKVTLPWKKCGTCNSAEVRKVCVLKKHTYECPSCKYSWEVKEACSDEMTSDAPGDLLPTPAPKGKSGDVIVPGPGGTMPNSQPQLDSVPMEAGGAKNTSFGLWPNRTKGRTHPAQQTQDFRSVPIYQVQDFDRSPSSGRSIKSYWQKSKSGR